MDPSKERLADAWERHVSARSVAGLFATVVAYVLFDEVSEVLNAAVVPPILGTLSLNVALPLPLGLVFGLPGAVAAVVGYLATGLGSFGAENVFVGVGHFFLALTGATLRPHSNADSGDGVSRDWSLKGGLQEAGVWLLGVAGMASIVAWGFEVTRIAPFYVTVVVWFLSLLLVVGLLSPLVAYGIWLLARRTDSLDGLDDDPGSGSVRLRNTRVAGVVVVAWILIGVVGSIGYRILEVLSPRAVPNGLDVLLFLDRPDIFGQGGTLAHLVFGSVMFSFLVHSYFWEMN